MRNLSDQPPSGGGKSMRCRGADRADPCGLAVAQSHGMHFFHLAAPDLLFGFDSDPATRNVFRIVKENPELALKAVNLRRYGQQIIERLGGKRIHANFAVTGGVNAPLTRENRKSMASELKAMIEIAKEAISIAKGWLETNKDTATRFASFPSSYMGLVDKDGGLQLYDGEIRVKDSEGQLLAQFKTAHYLSYIAEHVEPWSFLKHPYLRMLGWPEGFYRVGPLGRLNVIDHIPSPQAQEEFKIYRQVNGGRPVEGSCLDDRSALRSRASRTVAGRSGYHVQQSSERTAVGGVAGAGRRSYRSASRNAFPRLRHESNCAFDAR